MKKYLFAALALLVFQACDKDDDKEDRFTTVGVINEIKISNIEENYPSLIEEITFVARVSMPSGVLKYYNPTREEYAERAMTSVVFNKKAMTLPLPANPPQSLFFDIANDLPQGLTISDPSAKTISFTDIAFFEAGNSRQELQGVFEMSKSDDDIRYSVNYIYCDKPVKITGTADDWWSNIVTYDLTLQKGWNMVVEKRTTGYPSTITYTNSLPDGMRWTYVAHF